MITYLDNAATTPLDPRVLDAMLPFLKANFGNPSSSHALGRQAREAVEKARKTIAQLLNASPAEIYFTSGATESDNLALTGSIRALPIRHAITSRIEHHAVLQCLHDHQDRESIQLHYVNLDEKGHLSLGHLVELLQQYPGALVSLMHGNNEIGNLNDLATIAQLCRRYGAVFHSDTVQTMGGYGYDLQKLPLDYLVGSAHKFYGPKGIGFIYVNRRLKPQALLRGGGQENNLRAGTENVAAIVGLANALEIAQQERRENQDRIAHLKQKLIRNLRQNFPQITFNGDCTSVERSLYTVIHAAFPRLSGGRSLRFILDEAGIAVSGGSACSSQSGSHVLQELDVPADREPIRISLGKFNTEAEIDQLLAVLSSVYAAVPQSARREYAPVSPVGIES
jgi:cysteine desulfurase